MPTVPDTVQATGLPAAPAAPLVVAAAGLPSAPSSPLASAPTPSTTTAGVAATLTQANIKWTAQAAGAAGNGLTIGISNPAGYSCAFSVTNNLIQITPSANGVMIVTGASTTGVNGSYIRDLSDPSGSIWTIGGLPLASIMAADYSYIQHIGGRWAIQRYTPAQGVLYLWTSTADGATPAGLSYSGSTGAGVPTVTAYADTVGNVIIAANATPTVAALVIATASGSTTGTITTQIGQLLTGGGGLESPVAANGNFVQSYPAAPLAPTAIFTQATPEAPTAVHA